MSYTNDEIEIIKNLACEIMDNNGTLKDMKESLELADMEYHKSVIVDIIQEIRDEKESEKLSKDELMIKELEDKVRNLEIELQKKDAELEVIKKTKKSKKESEKNSIGKREVNPKDRGFVSYTMKYIPDGTELVMNFKGHLIKCRVDYESKSFIADDNEKHGTLNMVYTKFYKNNIDADSKVPSKNGWEHFKWDGKSISNLYVSESDNESNDS